ncbi:unnamed protein product [Prunus armeniaca]
MVVLREFGGCQPIYKDADKVVSLTSSQVRKDSSDPKYSCSEDDDSSDPNFEDSDYAQSDEEIDLLKKDDKWFEGYVDHSCIDNDPNAEENDESDNGEESPTLTCPNSSSSEDEIVGELRRKKNRMPKGENFRPEIDMANPEQVHQDYGYRPSRATVYRARAMAVDIVEGSYSKQYGVLWDYCHELRTRNVGSTIIIKSEMKGDRPRFHRIYICLVAYKKGFLDGCRHVVCLDGCHVKGPYLEQVLSAMGVDANNGMFPLANAYVEIESNSTWLWFLKLLSGDLNIRNNYVFMTNKQKDLIDVVDALFPHAEHRHCLKHLYGNFYLEHRGLASKHQKEVIVRATTMPWHVEMRKMLELSKPAHD